LSIGK